MPHASPSLAELLFRTSFPFALFPVFFSSLHTATNPICLSLFLNPVWDSVSFVIGPQPSFPLFSTSVSCCHFFLPPPLPPLCHVCLIILSIFWIHFVCFIFLLAFLTIFYPTKQVTSILSSLILSTIQCAWMYSKCPVFQTLLSRFS